MPNPTEEHKVPIVTPEIQEDMKKLFEKVNDLKECTEIYEGQEELMNQQWFIQLYEHAQERIIMNNHRTRVKERLSFQNAPGKFTHKKVGYCRLIEKSLENLLYGYGEIQSNGTIMLTVIYGSAIFEVGAFFVLPLSEWYIRFVSDSEFIELLAQNDRFNEVQAELKQSQEQNKYVSLTNENLVKVYKRELDEAKAHPFKTFFKNVFRKEKPAQRATHTDE